MEQLAKTHLSLRVPPRTLDRLTRRAQELREPRTTLAAQLLEQGLRSLEHPGIIFRAGASGPRAALAGHRLDVADIVATWNAEGRNIAATAGYFRIDPGHVRAAVDYCLDYPDEIEAELQLKERTAHEAEELARRREPGSAA